MKRLLPILLLLLAAAPFAAAQKGMAVDKLFDRFKDRENAVEVTVKSKMLKATYRLTLFRSLTVDDDPETAAVIEQAVLADGAAATDKETGTKGGKLYYAFFSFTGSDGTHRYIFYRNDLLRKGAKPETTVVYMEGEATLSELKKFFR